MLLTITSVNHGAAAGGPSPRPVKFSRMLQLAVQYGNRKVLEDALDAGLPVNAKTSNNKATPLHIAVYFNQPEIVKLLLERHADVAAKDYRERTPLSVAVDMARENNNSKIIEMLLEHNVPVRARDNGQQTPFLENHVMVNAQHGGGNTLLHAAAMRGNTDTAKVLLDFGADFEIKNGAGTTAEEIAAERSPYWDRTGVAAAIEQARKEREARREDYGRAFSAAVHGSEQFNEKGVSALIAGYAQPTLGEIGEMMAQEKHFKKRKQ